MKNKWILAAVIAAATTLAIGSGCSQSREIGKSTTQLVRGETGATVEQSPQQVAQAVDAAIADVKLIRINATTRPSATGAETLVIARNTQDAKIQVAYRPIDATNTRVVVSTGAFGNSELRDRVWDAVRIRLGLINIAAAPTTQPAPTATAAAPTTQPAPVAAQTPATTQPTGATPTASTGN